MNKLAAVNAMLAAIGEDPVATLDDGGPADAMSAVRTLDEVSREVQQVGWLANSDHAFSVLPDSNGWITVGPDVLSIKTSGRSRGRKVSSRIDPTDGQRKLWDTYGQTFVFTGSITLDIIRVLDFEDLTPPLQAYIKARAALKHQTRVLGSEVQDAMLQRDVADTWAQLTDAEAQEEDDSLLDNPQLGYGRRRNSILRGGIGTIRDPRH
jgi:hypothetical protein